MPDEGHEEANPAVPSNSVLPVKNKRVKAKETQPASCSFFKDQVAVIADLGAPMFEGPTSPHCKDRLECSVL